MYLVFQYGSNMDVTRINNPERLGGRAIPLGVAVLENYELIFNVQGRRVVSNIHPAPGKKLYGVLFYLPDRATYDKLASVEGKTLGIYTDISVSAKFRDVLGKEHDVVAATFVGAQRGLQNFSNSPDKRISGEYTNYIFSGIRQFRIPGHYRKEVEKIIREHNAQFGNHNAQPVRLQAVVQKLFSLENLDKTDVVRMRQKLRNQLGIAEGDKIFIHAPHKTAVFSVIKGPKDTEGSPENSVFMSQKVRQLLGVNIGSQIYIEPHKNASSSPSPSQPSSLAQKMQKIFSSLFGSKRV